MTDARTQGEKLWCVHIVGPDDVYAAPSEVEARRAVGYMEAHWKKIEPDSEVNRMVRFEAIPWPHSAESHAKDVGRFYAEIGPPPLDPHAQRANEEFEGIGKLYEARFHRLRPGKDDPLHDSMSDDNVRQFSDWIRHEALTDAIFRIIELERQLQIAQAALDGAFV